MNRADLSWLLTIALVFPISGAASPQTPASDPGPTPVLSYDTPAHVSLVDGAAVLEREGRSEELHAGVSLLQGDRVKTSVGRVEILFPDGSALYLDEYTQIDFLSDALARVLSGRIAVVLAGATDTRRDVRYQVDTPGGVVRMVTPGEFRVGLLDSASGRGREVVLEVVRGEAELSTERGAVPVGAGERAVARDGLAPSFPIAFNSARLDAFDLWAASRRDARLGTRSTQYLPEPLHVYGGTFDRYGSWQYNAPYGNVWYPSAPVGWRPYFNGYWRYTGPYGWSWVAYDPWGWPTHHFGRWGRTGLGAWFWIPMSRWAPAWVSWGFATGYVAWCPLGFDNRPIFGFGHHDPFLAWTVIPHHSFGRVRRVHTVVVDHRTFGRDRPAFVERPIPPAAAHAVARPSAPLRAPTRGDFPRGYAVPRSAPAGGGTSLDAGAPASVAPPVRSFGIMGPGAAPRRWPQGDGSPDSRRLGAGARIDVPPGDSPMNGRTPDTVGPGAVPRQRFPRGREVLGAPRPSAGASRPDDLEQRSPALGQPQEGQPQIAQPQWRAVPRRPADDQTPPRTWERAPSPRAPRGEMTPGEIPRAEPPARYRERPPQTERGGAPDRPRDYPRAVPRAPERSGPPPDRGPGMAPPPRRNPGGARPAPPPRAPRGEMRSAPPDSGGGAAERPRARPRGGGEE
ncbi:MAG: FecR domain-containing protein [Acidobacteria bacterium]|nr:FecR domain-containing protein [Acidobacteriota bacterium]